MKKNINSNRSTNCQKGLCGIRTSTWDARLRVWRKCGTDEDLQGLKCTGNEKLRHKLSNLLPKCQKGTNSFNVEISKIFKEVKRHSN